MARMNPPFSKAVVDVPKDLVERYAALGWSKVAVPADDSKESSPAPRRPRKRTQDKVE